MNNNSTTLSPASQYSNSDKDGRHNRNKSLVAAAAMDAASVVSSRTARSNKTAATVATSTTTAASRRIQDESVQLDLPMADLMAYLQVVANNSSNLPLTRRDDPELGRTVSSLTSEEYALKCKAFIPANVRILGGMYGKYGSVWDLPTGEVSSSSPPVVAVLFGAAFYYSTTKVTTKTETRIYTNLPSSLLSTLFPGV